MIDSQCLIWWADRVRCQCDTVIHWPRPRSWASCHPMQSPAVCCHWTMPRQRCPEHHTTPSLNCHSTVTQLSLSRHIQSDLIIVCLSFQHITSSQCLQLWLMPTLIGLEWKHGSQFYTATSDDRNSWNSCLTLTSLCPLIVFSNLPSYAPQILTNLSAAATNNIAATNDAYNKVNKKRTFVSNNTQLTQNSSSNCKCITACNCCHVNETLFLFTYDHSWTYSKCELTVYTTNNNEEALKALKDEIAMYTLDCTNLISHFCVAQLIKRRRTFPVPSSTCSWRVTTYVVLLRFQKFCCRSVSVGFARKTAVFGSVSVFVCPIFPLSSMWYVYVAHCTSNLQQYVTYFCV